MPYFRHVAFGCAARAGVASFDLQAASMEHAFDTRSSLVPSEPDGGYDEQQRSIGLGPLSRTIWGKRIETTMRFANLVYRLLCRLGVARSVSLGVFHPGHAAIPAFPQQEPGAWLSSSRIAGPEVHHLQDDPSGTTAPSLAPPKRLSRGEECMVRSSSSAGSPALTSACYSTRAASVITPRDISARCCRIPTDHPSLVESVLHSESQPPASRRRSMTLGGNPTRTASIVSTNVAGSDLLAARGCEALLRLISPSFGFSNADWLLARKVSDVTSSCGPWGVAPIPDDEEMREFEASSRDVVRPGWNSKRCRSRPSSSSHPWAPQSPHGPFLSLPLFGMYIEIFGC